MGGVGLCPLEAQTVKTLDQFEDPVGVAVDGSGNLYVSWISKYGGGVLKGSDCASGSCVITAVGSGFEDPFGVAVDRSGNVYVADTDHNAVKEVPPGCASASCVTTLGGGFKGPYGVAVDVKGKVYVADTGNNAVKEMPADCGFSSVGCGF